MDGITAEGLAYLCFNENSSKLFGLMVTRSREQYGITGVTVEKTNGQTDFHECCFDELCTIMKVTVIDYNDFDQQHVIDHVMRTGGDNCSLVSPSLSFTTEDLLIGTKAEDCIRKYFPNKLLHKDWFVCIGKMTLEINPDESVNKCRPTNSSCCS